VLFSNTTFVTRDLQREIMRDIHTQARVQQNLLEQRLVDRVMELLHPKNGVVVKQYASNRS
jgi:hypothetical protein